jgi:hypothetical protein
VRFCALCCCLHCARREHRGLDSGFYQLHSPAHAPKQADTTEVEHPILTMNALNLAGESIDDADGCRTSNFGQAEAAVACAVRQAEQSLPGRGSRPGLSGALALMPAVVVSMLFSYGMHCSDASVPDPDIAVTDASPHCQPVCTSSNVADAAFGSQNLDVLSAARRRTFLHRVLQDQHAMRDLVMNGVQLLQQACAYQNNCICQIRAMQQGMHRLHNTVVSRIECKGARTWHGEAHMSLTMAASGMWAYPQAMASDTWPIAHATSVSATSTWSKLRHEGLL